MTIQENTICNLIQTFPVLLILAQKQNKCLETQFVYKPPSPTQTPEYYQALDALFQNLYGHTTQPCYYSSKYGTKPCSYGSHGVSYGSHGTSYGSHGYGIGSYGAHSPSYGSPGTGYGSPGVYFVPSYKKGNIYSANVTYGHGYASTQSYTNNRNKIVVKKTRISRRKKKSEKLQAGGDDVQQLCDAGEEEFLEIMALVGMASKPLHVRRLQKALQEWVNNPALFQIPIVPNLCTDPFMQCNQRLLNIPPSVPLRTVASPESRPMYSPSPGAPENSCSSNASAPNASPGHTTFSKIVLPPSPAAPVTSTARSFSPQSACPPASAGSSPSSVTSPVQLTPVLLDLHVQKLSAAAEKLSKHLPQLEPKPQNTKKKMCKDLELVMAMPASDPRRMEEVRKYAAIYGRFDCKRKPEKPLTLHEVMVNEAAAQICRCVPALLTRRDELFPLARQLVRRAGLHYTKHSLPPTASTGDDRERDEDESSAKRPRQESEDNGVRVSPDAARGNSNHGWWGVKTESDDADSRCSYSSTSTPPPETEETRPQVVAARGDSIIAVANPALHPPHIPPPAHHQLHHPARNHSN